MRITAVLATTAAVVVTAVGCGSSSSSSSSASSGSSGSATVDPNAAEVNPAGDIPDDQVFVA
ncbi:MAG: hypothetical protein QOF76_5642, partial [Solirubrobacteraceae bacterium]|nr:hypothetical protein [Solirubrobacteraceae bacterium]